MKNRIRVLMLAMGCLGLFQVSARAQSQSNAKAYVVNVTATTTSNPPRVVLHWPKNNNATSYEINRRDSKREASFFETQDYLENVTDWTDSTVEVGKVYEYMVTALDTTATGGTYSAYGLINAGVDVTVGGSMGKVLLIVDNSFSTDLATELTRLEADLVSDGWQVSRHDVPREGKVTDVKSWIVSQYQADPENVRTVFLFGHVPVPYSGNYLAVSGKVYPPDGHPDHGGAWPADVYYGDVDGKWTDASVTNTVGSRDVNRNLPGDGKFDQTELPSDIDLEVGRVDFANMPAFATTEKELLRQYLNKDHAWRTLGLVVPQRALVNINFGVFNDGDVPGEDAWRNFPLFVGKNIDVFNNVQEGISTAGDWFSKIDTAAYLWAYGCGGGSYNSCGGVGTTAQYATAGARAVFFMQFGSYFGDWDAQDNFTRAPLATTNALTSCWVSRPFWFVHSFAFGETIGFGARETQNAGFEIRGPRIAREVHVALMGDPTLKLNYRLPAQNLTAQVKNSTSVDLSWASSQQSAIGYNIYRATRGPGPFTKINTSLVTSTSFTDNTPLADTNSYIVRAVSLSNTPGSTYMYESPGIDAQVHGLIQLAVHNPTANQNNTLRIIDEGNRSKIVVTFDEASAIDLGVYDLTGRLVRTLAHQQLAGGRFTYTWDYTSSNGSSIANGTYIVRMLGAEGQLTNKVIVQR